MKNVKNYFLMSETVKELLFEGDKPKEDCFFYVNACPLCGSHKKYLFKQWGINYNKCRNCGFVFSSPRLTDKGASIWYNSDYYNAAMKTEHYIAENFSKYYSISLNQLHFNKFVDLFKRHDFPHNISIADVGCGSGAIIHYLKNELSYKNVIGYDLNTSNIQFASKFRDVEIRNVDIYDLDNTKQFEVVITTENIEHVSNPIEYIEQLKNIIKPGGYLFLTTPHNDKLATKLMGLFGDHFCAPNHQNYFNLTNLKKLFSDNGFDLCVSWLDTSKQFTIISFIKRFFKKQDQITTYPPNRAYLKTIWKWQNNNHKSVKFTSFSNSTTVNINDSIGNSNRLLKAIIKMINHSLPIYFKKHQILVFRNNE